MILLWIDLESTGLRLDLRSSKILEVGYCISDDNLTLLDPGGSFFIDHGKPVGEIRKKCEDGAKAMHDASGFWDAYRAATHWPLRSALDLIANRAGTHAETREEFGHGEQEIVIAGSGIANFDRPWLRQFAAGWDEQFPYWSIDVGSVRRFAAHVLGLPKPPEMTGTAHRAHDDAYDALIQARYYRDLLKPAMVTDGLAFERGL